jgi:hypothetical protein
MNNPQEEYRAAVQQAVVEIRTAARHPNVTGWVALVLGSLGMSLLGILAIAVISQRDPVHERMVRDVPTYGPSLSLPVTRYDQWRISAGTVDGGAPTEVLDEVDGGDVDPRGIVYVDMVNDNSTCVNCGSCGQGDAAAVDGNTGWEIGTGAGCVDGPGVTVDGRADDLCCLSQGAATLVRVNIGRQ